MSDRPLSPAKESGSPRAPADPIDAIGLLAEPNRRRLYDLVAARHGGEISRDDAAGALGISRELVAFHLDRLVAGGLLETAYRRPHGRRGGPGAGRPAKLYRRAQREIGVSLPERRYADVAGMLAEGLERLGESVGTATVVETVGEVARAHGRESGRSLRRELTGRGGRPSRARLREALSGFLQRLGYEPEPAAPVATGAGSGRAPADLVLCNCPYRPIAEAHRDVTCGMNMAWAEGLADGLGDATIVPRFTPTPGRCCVTFATEPR